MKKQSGYVFGILLLLCLFLPEPVLAAKAIKLTYANFPPAPTFPCVQMERWKQEVEQRSGGRLAVQTFPGGTLLGAKNMFDGVVMGQADIGCFAMSYHPGRFPLAEAVDLPLGWPNATVASLTLWDIHNKYQPESFKKVKVLTMFTCPPANIMSIDPVRSLDDLKGLEIRAAGTGVKIFELLGASPIGMPQSDVPDALHKKVIKGMASSLEVMKDFNYAEYCRYITMTNLQVVSFAVVMNLSRWDSLSDDIKNMLEELGREQVQWTGRYVDEHVNEAVAWSKKTFQVEVVTLAPEEQTRMNDLLKPLVDEYIVRTASQLPSEDIIRDVRLFKDKYTAELTSQSK
ncbi:MAG: TRAP transporter substrate-binding protein [Deltaproteobacteria bacterium]|nr:TRAP transporter substrate-binding protein [Deltaproteobacteria bacterium]